YWVAGIAALYYSALAFLEGPLGLKPPEAFASVLGITPPGDMPWGYVLTVSAALLMAAYVANYFAGLLTRDEGTIRSQLEEMNSLHGATQKMATTLDVEEAMRNLVSVAMDLERPRSCYLILFNENNEGYYAAAAGMSAEEREHNRLHPLTPDHPVVEHALRDRQGIYAPDLEALPELKSALQSGS